MWFPDVTREPLYVYLYLCLPPSKKSLFITNALPEFVRSMKDNPFIGTASFSNIMLVPLCNGYNQGNTRFTVVAPRHQG